MTTMEEEESVSATLSHFYARDAKKREEKLFDD